MPPSFCVGAYKYFYVNAKNPSEFLKLWIRVVNFDSYLPYVLVVIMFVLYSHHDSTKDFPGKGRFFGIRPF